MLFPHKNDVGDVVSKFEADCIGYNPVMKLLSPNPRKNYIGFINCYLIEGYELPVPIKITIHPWFYKLGNTFEECVKKFLKYEDDYLRRLNLYFS